MQLVYGTTNSAKVEHMQQMTAGLGLDIVGLESFPAVPLPEIAETGQRPVDNARLKAEAYFSILKRPVLSADSGLYIEGLPPDQQPGLFIRRVEGRYLDDSEMIAHYRGIAAKLGGQARAQFINGICLFMDENTVYQEQGPQISSPPFFLVDEESSQRQPGLPLDSISKTMDSGQFVIEVRQQVNDNDSAMAAGFCSFIMRALEHYARVSRAPRIDGLYGPGYDDRVSGGN